MRHLSLVVDNSIKYRELEQILEADFRFSNYIIYRYNKRAKLSETELNIHLQSREHLIRHLETALTLYYRYGYKLIHFYI